MGKNRSVISGLGKPLSRARLTARVSAAVSGAPLLVDDRLRELDFGAGEGLTAAEMAQQFPDALEAFRADSMRNYLPEGEDPYSRGALGSCLPSVSNDPNAAPQWNRRGQEPFPRPDGEPT